MITCVRFSPDGNFVATCGTDKKINIYDFARTQHQLRAETPAYRVGRLPTEECEITVTVEDMTIAFNWKLSDKIEADRRDCIGLYIHDREFSNKYEAIKMLDGKKTGSGSFTAPTIGYFDLRFYPKYCKEEHSRSEPFLVGPKMTVNAKLEGRRRIAVTWDRDLQKDGDWLALYPVGRYSNAKYMQFVYASKADNDGKVYFDAPRTPGEYEVRYFFTSKRTPSGYAYSGKSEPVVVIDEDMMEVIETHPIVKVRWQTFSQVPNSRDYIGVYPSSDAKASALGYAYCKSGAIDSVGDHGVAEIEIASLKKVTDGKLPEGAENWEVRLYNRAVKQPFLRIPFISN